MAKEEIVRIRIFPDFACLWIFACSCPNVCDIVQKMIDEIQPAGNVFTGGITDNSFRNKACVEVNDFLVVLAKTDDGVVEAVKAKNARILATMWHPERGKVFVRADIERMR